MKEKALAANNPPRHECQLAVARGGHATISSPHSPHKSELERNLMIRTTAGPPPEDYGLLGRLLCLAALPRIKGFTHPLHTSTYRNVSTYSNTLQSGCIIISVRSLYLRTGHAALWSAKA